MQWKQCLRTESTNGRHQISITSLLTTPHYQFRVLGRPPYPAYIHTYKVNGERSVEIAGSGTAGGHFLFPPHSSNNPRWSMHTRTCTKVRSLGQQELQALVVANGCCQVEWSVCLVVLALHSTTAGWTDRQTDIRTHVDNKCCNSTGTSQYSACEY